jgi:hypothetical protein
METPYRKDCSQDPGHMRKNRLPLQTCLSIIKFCLYKALFRAITAYDSHLEARSQCSPLEAVELSELLAILTGAQRSEECTWPSKFLICMIT